MKSKLVSFEEAAARFSVHPNTIKQRKMCFGNLTHVREGQGSMLIRAEVDKLMSGLIERAKVLKAIQHLERDLVTQSAAAKLRRTSVAALNELVARGRLVPVELFGLKLLMRSEVKGFKREKPGPKPTQRKR